MNNQDEDKTGAFIFLFFILMVSGGILISHLMGGLWGSHVQYQSYELDLSRTYNAQELISIDEIAGITDAYVEVVEDEAVILHSVTFDEKPDKVGLYELEDYWILGEEKTHLYTNVGVVLPIAIVIILCVVGMCALSED